MDWTFEMEMGESYDYSGGDDLLEKLKDYYENDPLDPKPEPNPDPQPKAELLVMELSLWPEIQEQREDLSRHVELIFGAEIATDSFEFVTDRIEDEVKELEEEDQLGNHEIQRLMQQMNSAETLESNVRKKTDDTANAIIGKI